MTPLYGKYWLHKYFCHVLPTSLAFSHLPVLSATFRYIDKDLLEHSGSFRPFCIYTTLAP